MTGRFGVLSPVYNDNRTSLGASLKAIKIQVQAHAQWWFYDEAKWSTLPSLLSTVEVAQKNSFISNSLVRQNASVFSILLFSDMFCTILIALT